ncbi:MAG: DNA repair protein RecO, partial [Pseudobdellovibrio sp.]
IIHAIGIDGAKTSFIAKSALKSKKRFGGGILEPLHFVSFTYKENQNSSQMKTLNEASLIEDFKDIRSSYDKLELALFVVNCVSHVSLEGDQNSEFLFNLTGHALRAVSRAQNLNALKLHFCLKFLYQQGVISMEPWMSVFLKTNISDFSVLADDVNIQIVTENYLDSMELLVTQYIKTADSGFS